MPDTPISIFIVENAPSRARTQLRLLRQYAPCYGNPEGLALKAGMAKGHRSPDLLDKEERLAKERREREAKEAQRCAQRASKQAEAWRQWRQEHPDLQPDLSGANLNDRDLRGLDLRGVNLTGANLSRTNLKGTNLSRAILTRANLSQANLDEALLLEADLIEATLVGTKLRGADLSRAQLQQANLYEADLSEALPQEVDLTKVLLPKKAKLNGADLTGATLSDANLRGAICRGAHLIAANLTYVDLSRADLTKAILSGADLRHAILRETHLDGAILTQADLSGAYLIEAILLEANLEEATLTGATLRGADLSQAKLKQANLSQADLSEVILREMDLTEEVSKPTNLRGADLTEANLCKADLRGAILKKARLKETDLKGANLSQATLDEAILQEVDVKGTTFDGASIHGTFFLNVDLSKTKESSGYAQEPGMVARFPVWILLPMRIFLGATFIYAGLQKLTDPQFFNPSMPGYIGHQIMGFAQGSPLHDFLIGIALPHAVLFGWATALGEMAIGLGTYAGFLFRPAAFFGMLLNLTFFLSASWNVYPYFYGADIVFVFCWVTMMLSGPLNTGLPSVDDWLVDQLVPEGHTQQNFHPLLQVYILLVVAGTPQQSSYTAGISLLRTNPITGGSLQAYQHEPGATQIMRKTRRSILQDWFVAGAATVASMTLLGIPLRIFGKDPHANGAGTMNSTISMTSMTSTSTTPIPVRPVSVGESIAPVSAVPKNSSVTFIIASSQDAGILVHLPNDMFVAYDAVCTHAGCTVDYNPDTHTLECPCHGSQFDPAKGAVVLTGPATTPLRALSIQIDSATGAITLH